MSTSKCSEGPFPLPLFKSHNIFLEVEETHSIVFQ